MDSVEVGQSALAWDIIHGTLVTMVGEDFRAMAGVIIGDITRTTTLGAILTMEVDTMEVIINIGEVDIALHPIALQHIETTTVTYVRPLEAQATEILHPIGSLRPEAVEEHLSAEMPVVALPVRAHVRQQPALEAETSEAQIVALLEL